MTAISPSLPPHKRIFVALDTTDLALARAMAAELVGEVGGLKLGLELFSARGTEGVRTIAEAGLPLFLDLKFHDIPNTVGSAVRAAHALTPFLVTVHASGGPAMLRAAAEAAAEAKSARTRIIAVTVLTSLDDQDLAKVGQQTPALDQVKRLAALAQDCGIDGVVCSPREAAALRVQCGKDFLLVVPGIRPAWAAAQDQKRAATPAEAVAAGADYLVIGRPITGAPSPRDAARRVAEEIAAAG